MSTQQTTELQNGMNDKMKQKLTEWRRKRQVHNFIWRFQHFPLNKTEQLDRKSIKIEKNSTPPLWSKWIIQWAWVMQILHIPRKGLALDWFLGDNLWVLGISCVKRVSLYSWHLGPHHMLIKWLMNGKCLFLFAWGPGPYYISVWNVTMSIKVFLSFVSPSSKLLNLRVVFRPLTKP